MQVKFHTWNYAGTFYVFPALSVSSLIKGGGIFITVSWMFRSFQLTIQEEGENTFRA